MADSLFRIAIHGGAGVLDPQSFPQTRRRAVAQILHDIVAAATSELRAGAEATTVVANAVAALEDAEFFNAGYGAVLNADGEAELDAAIMDGRDRSAGAVCAARGLRNPVRVAEAIRRDGQHVLLGGDGARRFAIERGLAVCESADLIVPIRLAQLQAAQRQGRITLDHDERYDLVARNSGTVGAVARDVRGHLAAATSTGGMTNKRVGRVGDAPLIGCGTFADNATCAISATGHGEFFIRSVLAHDIHARMHYRDESLDTAAQQVLAACAARGGVGGLIGVSRDGDLVLPFNAPGMYRAWFDGEAIHVGIYRELEV